MSVKRVSIGGLPRKRSADFIGRLVQMLTGAIIIGGCYLGWLGYQWGAHSDAFMISNVDVKGVRQLTEKDLKEIAGAFTGQNIFRVDIDGAARRARVNPWVKDVRLYRRLPNRISMIVSERVPVATLDNGKGRYLIDEEGTAIEKVTRENTNGWRLPLITIKDAKIHPGEGVTSGGIAEALALLTELAARGGWRMSEVSVKADAPESLTVVYADREFKLGSGRFPEKLKRLGEIMADAAQRGLSIAYVDLRPEHQAALMVKNSKAQGTGARVRKKG